MAERSIRSPSSRAGTSWLAGLIDWRLGRARGTRVDGSSTVCEATLTGDSSRKGSLAALACGLRAALQDQAVIISAAASQRAAGCVVLPPQIMSLEIFIGAWPPG